MNNVVFINQSEIERTIKEFNEHIPTFQKVRNEFKDLQCGEISTREQLLQSVANPEQFLIQRLTERIAADNSLSFAGFKMSPAKLVDLLDLQEKEQFLKAAKFAQPYIHYFEKVGTITNKAKIEQDKSRVDELIRQFTILAITDRQKVVLDAMRTIQQAAEILENSKYFNHDEILSRPIIHFIKSAGAKGYAVNHDNFSALGGQ
jgi:hypothetical protein